MEMLSEVTSVTLANINLTLDSNHILHNLNFKIENGGIHCLLGPNGAGKTLTNKILSFLLKMDNGEIYWNDELVKIKSEKDRVNVVREIGFMNQKPVFLSKSLRANIEIPLRIRGLAREEREKMVSEGLTEFGLKDKEDQNAMKLSSGQQQKAAMLRTTIHHPKLLIVDEPTASLDQANTKWMEDYITQKQKTDKVLIFWTTHDHFQAKRIGKNVTIMIDGKIEETGKVIDIFSNSQNERVKSYLKGELV